MTKFEFTPEVELKWCQQDLRIAADNLAAAQRQLNDAIDDHDECQRRLAEAQRAVPMTEPPEPWMPQPPAHQFCPACQQPSDQCVCGRTPPRIKSANDERKLCPIWDCKCTAGAQLREAWINMNRILDQYGDSPQYRTSWDSIERFEAQRQATCHCPTT